MGAKNTYSIETQDLHFTFFKQFYLKTNLAVYKNGRVQKLQVVYYQVENLKTWRCMSKTPLYEMYRCLSPTTPGVLI